MKMYSADAGEIVEIQRIEPKEGMLLLHGRIFGTMPMTAQLRPEEVRSGLKLLNLKLVLFLLTLPFRRSTSKG